MWIMIATTAIQVKRTRHWTPAFLATALLGWPKPTLAAATGTGTGTGPHIATEDVDLFFKVYEAADGHPSASALQYDYIEAGSEGLHQFASVRDLSGEWRMINIDTLVIVNAAPNG